MSNTELGCEDAIDVIKFIDQSQEREQSVMIATRS